MAALGRLQELFGYSFAGFVVTAAGAVRGRAFQRRAPTGKASSVCPSSPVWSRSSGHTGEREDLIQSAQSTDRQPIKYMKVDADTGQEVANRISSKATRSTRKPS
jgi:hypothetical protein